MAVFAFLMLLFTAWMLYGWCVGESADVKWLRICCAPTFVVMVTVISAGAAAKVALVTSNKASSAFHSDVTALLKAVEQRVGAGDTRQVLTELRRLNRSDDPDAAAPDVRKEISAITERLEGRSTHLANAATEESVKSLQMQ